MTLRNDKILKFETEGTRSHFVKNSLEEAMDMLQDRQRNE